MDARFNSGRMQMRSILHGVCGLVASGADLGTHEGERQ